MKVKMLLLVPSIVGTMLTGCSGGNGSKSSQDSVPAIDMTALDTTVNPAEDFYLFVNGGWIKTIRSLQRTAVLALSMCSASALLSKSVTSWKSLPAKNKKRVRMNIV